MIDAELARYKAQYGDDIPAECHPDIRSREACMKSTELALSLARRHGTRLHVLHISTADELALFETGPLIRADGCAQADHRRDLHPFPALRPRRLRAPRAT